MSDYEALLPGDGGGLSEYAEAMLACIRNRYGYGSKVAYLDEIQRLTRERGTFQVFIDGRPAALPGATFANELRAHKWNEYSGPGAFVSDGMARTAHWTTGPQPGLSTRAWCEMMDAGDAEPTTDAPGLGDGAGEDGTG